MAASRAVTATEPPAAIVDPYERRRQRPVIIGGCDAACATPEAAVQAVFAALRAPDRVACLKPLVEWSLLVVEGKPLGIRWADQWADPARHPEREASIDAWLRAWPGWIALAETPPDYAKAVADMRIERVADGADEAPARFEITFPYPQLRDGYAEPKWRLGWTRRGYEWLLSSIDPAPGR